jgi:malonyl CoA-acyl carrier protein transacylase
MVVSSRLAPGNTVLSGDVAGCKHVQELAVRDFGASKVIPLKVAGAFHSSFMQPALEELRSALQEVEIRTPSVPVIANVDACAYTDVGTIHEKLCQQLTHPVEVGHVCVCVCVCARVGASCLSSTFLLRSNPCHFSSSSSANVQWQRTNEVLSEMKVTHWQEVGPGTVLCGLVRRMHRINNVKGTVVHACSIGSK